MTGAKTRSALSFECPACGCMKFDRSLPYAHRGRRESAAFELRALVRCRSCRAHSAYPLPSEDDLREYYALYWKGENDAERRKLLFEAQAEARAAFITPVAGPLRVLDIGAGFGYLRAALARAAGAPAAYDAVEWDALAREHLAAVADRMWTSSAEAPADYTLIVLSHVLEHMGRPLDFLAEQRSRIARGGRIFVEVPNQDHLFKQRNEPHLVFFSPLSLSRLMRRAGFRVVRSATCGEKINDIVRRTWPEAVTPGLSVFWPRAVRLLAHRAGIPIERESYGQLGKPAFASTELGPDATPEEARAAKRRNRRLVESEISRQTASAAVYGPGRRWIRLLAEVRA